MAESPAFSKLLTSCFNLDEAASSVSGQFAKRAQRCVERLVFVCKAVESSPAGKGSDSQGGDSAAQVQKIHDRCDTVLLCSLASALLPFLACLVVHLSASTELCCVSCESPLHTPDSA